MSERVAIVGSRYPSQPSAEYDALLEAVQRYVDALPLDTIVISGDAYGVDKKALNCATARGMITVSVPAHGALWRRLGKRAGHARSQVVVDISHRVVAFMFGETPGTRATIEYAREMGKPLQVRG